MNNPDIFSFIKQEENAFEQDIQVGDNWFWNFRKHVQLIFHLKNGIFFSGENNWLRSFKNIIEPMLELSYWTEDLEVKDVNFFIENVKGKVLSFFVKKYHDEVFTREHDLDTMFDEITESDLDYGGVLVQRGVDMPEVLALNSVAFCDQTDILGGVIAFKHNFSPEKLRAKSKAGWGNPKNGATISIEELIVLATSNKSAVGTKSGKQNLSTGKTIEVYVLRGSMPEHYLKDNDDMENHVNQLQIVAFYIDKDKNKQGVTLYRKSAEDDDILFFTSKKVFQRALGRGVGERLVGDQIWTNFLSIHKMGLIEASSKVTLYTDDPTYTQKNKIQDMENLEITTIEDNKQIRQIPNVAPNNIQLHENAINEWYIHAQLGASAQDPILGKEAASGTTFRGQERSVAQGRGSHDKRRGQRAKFIELIYRWDIIPRMVKEILKGKEFIATLSSEELTWVADQLAFNLAEERIKDLVLLKGKMVNDQDRETLRAVIKEDFLKKGNKHLLKILTKEFENIEIKMGINIAGKQKNLVELSDKLLSIFQFIFANPQGFQQAIQIPALAKSFENILEYGGMNIADFSTLLQAPKQPIPSPMQPKLKQPQLSLNNTNA
jgi:hypothetical protein